MNKIEQGSSQTQSAQIKTETNVNDNIKQANVHKKIDKELKELEGGKCYATCNGGDLQPIAWKIINAGEKHFGVLPNLQFRVLAPRVPTTDNAYCTLKAFFVPMSYMINNYDAKKAAKREIGQTINTALPTGMLNGGNAAGWGYYQDTTAWKSKVANFYIPNRFARGTQVGITPIRAYICARNAFCRNKDYVPALTEYKDETPTQAELDGYFGTFSNGNPVITSDIEGTAVPGDIMKDCARNSYYTDGKPYQQSGADTGTNTNQYMQSYAFGSSQVVVSAPGFYQGSNTIPTETTGNNTPSPVTANWYSQTAHIDWQNAVAELRRRANDGIKNNWDIIAQLGDCKPVTTDRPFMLASKTTKLNYQQITQSSVPTSGNGATPLGTPGAFSITENKDMLYGQHEFLQDGVLIITATFQVDTYFDNAIHRTGMLADTTQLYNPELAKKQVDWLLNVEIEGATGTTGLPNAMAWKRKYSEYHTMPNVFARDMRSVALTSDSSGAKLATIPEWQANLCARDDIYGGSDINANANSYSYIFKDNSAKVFGRNAVTTLSPFRGQDQCAIFGEIKVFAEVPTDQTIITEFGGELKK